MLRPAGVTNKVKFAKNYKDKYLSEFAPYKEPLYKIKKPSNAGINIYASGEVGSALGNR